MAFRSLLIPLLFASLFLSCVFADGYGENEVEDISYFFESTLTLREFSKSKKSYYSDFQYVTNKPFKKDHNMFVFDSRDRRLEFFMRKPDTNKNGLYQITAKYNLEGKPIQLYLCAKRNKKKYTFASNSEKKYLLVGNQNFFFSTEEDLTVRYPHCFFFSKVNRLNNNRYVSYSAYNYNEAQEEGIEAQVEYYRVETDTKYIVFRAAKKGEKDKLLPNPIQRLLPPHASRGSIFLQEPYYTEYEQKHHLFGKSKVVSITRNSLYPIDIYFEKEEGDVLYRIIAQPLQDPYEWFQGKKLLTKINAIHYNVALCSAKEEGEFIYTMVPLHPFLHSSQYPSECFLLGKLKNDDTNRFVKYSDYRTEQDIPVEEYKMMKQQNDGAHHPVYFSLLHRGESSQATRPVQTYHRRH